jgi:diguanylate cyclase (GGDEF)-like protein/PAS domain S-box-containing protein
MNRSITLPELKKIPVFPIDGEEGLQRKPGTGCFRAAIYRFSAMMNALKPQMSALLNWRLTKSRRVKMRNQAEARLSALIESTEDHIWSVGLDDRVILFNRAFQRHLKQQFDIQIVVGMRPEDFFPAEKAALWSSFFERAKTEGPFRTAYTLHNGDVYEMSLNPIIVEGMTTGISVFGKDSTKQKAAERALHEAERKYRDIFEGALEGMFQSTMDGRLLTANPALATMLGYASPDELIASVKDLGHDVWADSDERSRYLVKLKGHGAGIVLGFDFRLKRKDGTHIWASLSGRIVRNEDGTVLCHEGFVEDITERYVAEQELRESRDFLTEAQRIGALGVYVLDIPAGMWSSSPVLDELAGIDDQYERTVAGWVNLIHPDDRAMMADYFADEVIGQKKSFDKEYRVVRQADRVERWVHGMGKLEFDAQGQPAMMRGVIKDITDRKKAETQLRDNEERYRETFEQAAVGILHTSLDGRILRCNERFAQIIGYSPEEACNLTFQQITPREDLGHSVGVLKQMLDEATITPSWEKRYVRKDGTLTWVRLTVSTRRDGEGHALHFITVVEDINAAKAAELQLASAQGALRLSEERYRTAFQTSIDAIAINNLSDGKYIEVNQAFIDISGYSQEELVGHTSLELGIWVDPRDRVRMTEEMSLRSTCRNLETEFRKKDGTILIGLMSASIIEIEGVPCILSVTRDITEAKAAEKQIRDLAFYDPLTRLPNRRLLLERSRQALATDTPTGKRRALLIVNLDGFKSLNETLGHPTGDLILQEVARRLVTCIREPNMVARLAGDEFVVMLEGLSENPEEAAAQTEATGEKILATIAQPHKFAQRECTCTASIGITVFGSQSERTNDRLQQADMAMDQAKAAGGNTMRFFAPALQAAVNARVAMAEDLHNAIKHNQFVLHFQPQVDCRQWTGAEALIRWNHPRGGLILPDGFIPAAEATGLIVPVGNWVLETACAQIASWAKRSETAELAVSINISARQLRQPEFVHQVLATLERTGADPRRLELELTESMLVDDIEQVIAKMIALKSHGLQFSLDDFGTGYSSLTYLKRLPLDRLKIDRSFVRDILVDESSGAIAQTIISLSKAMGLPVIAEGVETEEQRVCLEKLGCHAFQGYLFSRPVPIQALELLLQGLASDESPIRC